MYAFIYDMFFFLLFFCLSKIHAETCYAVPAITTFDTKKKKLQKKTKNKEAINLDEIDDLFGDLIKFVRKLPPQSKRRIWEHAVCIKTESVKRQVLDETKTKHHIAILLCSLIILYIKVIREFIFILFFVVCFICDSIK